MIGRLAREDTFAEVGLWNVAKVAVAALFIIAGVVAGYAAPDVPAYPIVFSLASLAFTGFPIVWEALKGLSRLKTNVDELVSIAIVASLILEEWISAAIVAFIMVLGGLLEEFTSARARRQIEALTSSSPDHALLISPDGSTRSVAVKSLKPKDVIMVRPGDVIPVDGLIVEGESDVDESMLTGESIPVAKGPGQRVYAGAINDEGALKVQVERIGDATTQGKIIQLITEAEQHRAPILRAAENYAKWFTPAILLLAAAVFLVTRDPTRAVTMLIVGCPCAFVLATPTAVIAALGRASKHGILIKGGKYLEACAKVDTLAFDKTGTLTAGNYHLSGVIPLDGLTRHDILANAARLEQSADHPVARAVVAAATAEGLHVPPIAAIRREAGLGVSEVTGESQHAPWRIGSQRFMERQGVSYGSHVESELDALRAKGQSALLLAEGASLKGILALEDEVRAECRPTLSRLRQAGYGGIHILTGDAVAVARSVSEHLDLPDVAVSAEMLPQDKLRYIERLEQAGRRVCYVGDGTNDGPALAAASVGVSIGSRENTVALETAQVVLMKGGLAALPFLFRLAKATRRTINQNLVLFGLIFNALMLALSASGVLTPILGAFGHNLGSVAVVLNSARLLRFRDAPQSLGSP